MLATNQFDEEGHRRLIAALVAGGLLSEARLAYASYADRMDELGVPRAPLDELVPCGGLASRSKGNRKTRPAASSALHPAPRAAGARARLKEDDMNEQVTPEPILQLGLAFWGSKALLSAVELGVFTHLADGPCDARSLALELKLHPRGVRDFLDALVSLGMLPRAGDDYRNAAATDVFLDQNKPSYVGGLLEMANTRLY